MDENDLMNMMFPSPNVKNDTTHHMTRKSIERQVAEKPPVSPDDSLEQKDPQASPVGIPEDQYDTEIQEPPQAID
jgi:hypothetical protein